MIGDKAKFRDITLTAVSWVIISKFSWKQEQNGLEIIFLLHVLQSIVIGVKKFLHQLFLPCTAKANNSAASSKVMGNLPWRISLFICRKNWYLLKIECLVKTTCKGKTNLVMGNEVLSWNFMKKKQQPFGSRSKSWSKTD